QAATPPAASDATTDGYTLFYVRYPVFEPAIRVGSALFLGPPNLWEGPGFYVIDQPRGKPVLVCVASLNADMLQFRDHATGMWHPTSRAQWSVMNPRAVSGIVSYCTPIFRGFLESRFGSC